MLGQSGYYSEFTRVYSQAVRAPFVQREFRPWVSFVLYTTQTVFVSIDRVYVIVLTFLLYTAFVVKVLSLCSL